MGTAPSELALMDDGEDDDTIRAAVMNLPPMSPEMAGAWDRE